MQWLIDMILKNDIGENIRLCKQNCININITKWMKQKSIKRANIK